MCYVQLHRETPRGACVFEGHAGTWTEGRSLERSIGGRTRGAHSPASCFLSTVRDPSWLGRPTLLPVPSGRSKPIPKPLPSR